MATDFDVIVLGLGAMGSASVYQLAKRGVRVLGIDRFTPPHTFGSSHGETRITRQAIGEGEHYTPLVLRAYEIFRQLEAETGRKLLQLTGGLMISSEQRAADVHVAEFLGCTISAAKRFNIEHELLDTQQIRARFPQFVVSDGEYAYYEPGAGILFPEECIRTQLDMARQLGAVIHTNEVVASFSEAGSRTRMRTADGGEYTADKLVISAGTWLPQLLGGKYDKIFRVHRQVLYWFDIQDAFEQFSQPRFPIFIWEVQDRNSLPMYGFPAVDGPEGGFKLAVEEYQELTTPDTVNRTVSETEISRMREKQVQRFFPSAGARCIKTAVCMYTVTPDAGFVIDYLPASSSIIICSPCSGHGFKHSSAVGEIIAELATDTTPSIDIAPFKLSRLL
jgi:sarcosine oxidase